MSQHLQNRSKMWLGFEWVSLRISLAYITQRLLSRGLCECMCYCGRVVHGNRCWKKTRNDEVAYFLFYFYLCVGDVFRTWQRRARVTLHGIYIYGKKRTTIRNKCSGSRCHSLLSSVSAETWGNRNDYIMCMAKNCSQKSTFRVPINFVRRSLVSRRAPNAHHTRKLCGIQYASHFCWSGILLINVLSLGAGLQYTD